MFRCKGLKEEKEEITTSSSLCFHTFYTLYNKLCKNLIKKRKVHKGLYRSNMYPSIQQFVKLVFHKYSHEASILVFCLGLGDSWIVGIVHDSKMTRFRFLKNDKKEKFIEYPVPCIIF